MCYVNDNFVWRHKFMNIKKKLLEKCLKFIKRKKLPKQLAVVVLIVSLFFIYFLEFSYKIFKRVCVRKKLIVSLITIIAFFSVTYSFYNGFFSSKILADTIDQEEQSETFKDALDKTEDNNVEFLNHEDALSDYYIKVNRLQNSVTIYTTDAQGEFTIPIKAMICSTGGKNTPLGIYKISSKYEFKSLLYNVYGQYAVRVVGQILFHSSSYNDDKKDTLIADEYNKLGQGVSHGCIRLTVADAKWIYDNCDSGTVVEIYDSEDVGPLGKPSSIKVPEGTNWDPTDPDPNNPWNEKTPTIEGLTNKEVKVGTKIDLTENIKAYDTCGNDITDQLIITGTVNNKSVGKYNVKYYVTDLLGRMVIATVTYTVTE